jgi:hypothetical protein
MSENNLLNNLKNNEDNEKISKNINQNPNFFPTKSNQVPIKPMINKGNLNECQIIFQDLNEQKNIKDNNDNYQNIENQNERGKTIMSNKSYASIYQNGGSNNKEFYENFNKICDDKINQQNENNSGKNSNSSYSSKNNEEINDTEIRNIEKNGIISFSQLKKTLANKNKKIKELDK